jgi:hypothetical protein
MKMGLYKWMRTAQQKQDKLMDVDDDDLVAFASVEDIPHMQVPADLI